VNAPRVSFGAPDPDPLLDIFLVVRDALAPFGIPVDSVVLRIWREFQARGVVAFTGSGEFDPVKVGALEDAVALMRASAADGPPAPAR
jgi:hypothetical protein